MNMKLVKMDLFENCNGKMCGLGKLFPGNKYICPHNNLLAKHPHLKEEWDPSNLPMENFLPMSDKKVWWICKLNPCGCHRFLRAIKYQVRGKIQSCPYCSGRKICQHTNLEALYPHLKQEWDPSNPKKMSEYSPFSNQKVKWICSNNKDCECHHWECPPSSRTGSKNTGCPYCVSLKLCPHNNLLHFYPELEKEWSPNNPKKMSEYAPHSSEVVEWICSKSKCFCHKFMCKISHRTSNNKIGCPFCINFKLCEHNNLEYLYGHLKVEWSPRNKKKMNEYPPHSGERVEWICSKNPTHIWVTIIKHRTGNKSGCPHCIPKNYSKGQIEWLQEIEKEQNITIQHALSGGEFYIPGIGGVDGYCKETNTIYEYHGDYWHGNPNVFNSEDENSHNKKTFGELYQNTLIRDQNIRNLGYSLIIKWETDITYEP